MVGGNAGREGGGFALDLCIGWNRFIAEVPLSKTKQNIGNIFALK